MMYNERLTGAHHLLPATLMLGSFTFAVPACTGEELDQDEVAEDADLGEAAQPVYYDNHSYLFISTPGTWEQARATCKGNGYYLVTVNNQAEEAWLNKQELNKGGGGFWIGFSDKAFEKQWQWVSGNPSYKNWKPGSPSTSPGNVQDCALDISSNTADGQWSDEDCNLKRKFICERNW